MQTSLRLLALSLSLSIVLAACAGAPEAQNIIISSEDGLLSLEFAASSTSVEDVRIEILSGDALPATLRDAGFTGTVYDVEPGAATFTEPVTVTRLSDATAGTGPNPIPSIPIVALATLADDGTWEWMDDQQVRVAPGNDEMIQITASTNHFSTVVAFSGFARASLLVHDSPADVGRKVFSAAGVQTVGTIKTGFSLKGAVTYSGGALSFLDRGHLDERDEPFWGAEFVDWTCTAPGEDVFAAEISLRETTAGGPRGFEANEQFEQAIRDGLYEPFAWKFADRLETTVHLETTAACRAKAMPDPPKSFIVGTCAQWLHEAYDDYLSRVLYGILLDLAAAGIEPGGSVEVEMSADGVNNGDPVSATVEVGPDGQISVTGGIDVGGAHPLRSFVVKTADGKTLDLSKEAAKKFDDFDVGSDPSGEHGSDCGYFMGQG